LRVLILDFDGVVVESNSVKTEAFRELFSRFPAHTDHMMAYHREHISVTRFSKFDHLLERLGRAGDADLRDELAATFSGLLLERMRRVPLVPGAEDFLRMTAARLPLFLASVTPEQELEEILQDRGLRSWFCGVYGCPPWTKARAILDILDREGVRPHEALLVGDSAGDQRAAGETGVHFLARYSGLPFDDPTPLQFPDMTQLAEHLVESLP
jgi:phosphoglycolate phosphatase-like HAD superfamily hydrolase